MKCCIMESFVARSLEPEKGEDTEKNRLLRFHYFGFGKIDKIFKKYYCNYRG